MEIEFIPQEKNEKNEKNDAPRALNEKAIIALQRAQYMIALAQYTSKDEAKEDPRYVSLSIAPELDQRHILDDAERARELTSQLCNFEWTYLDTLSDGRVLITNNAGMLGDQPIPLFFWTAFAHPDDQHLFV